MIHVIALHGIGFTIFECHAFECEEDLNNWVDNRTPEKNVSLTQMTYTNQTLKNMVRDYPIFKHPKS